MRAGKVLADEAKELDEVAVEPAADVMFVPLSLPPGSMPSKPLDTYNMNDCLHCLNRPTSLPSPLNVFIRNVPLNMTASAVVTGLERAITKQEQVELLVGPVCIGGSAASRHVSSLYVTEPSTMKNMTRHAYATLCSSDDLDSLFGSSDYAKITCDNYSLTVCITLPKC